MAALDDRREFDDSSEKDGVWQCFYDLDEASNLDQLVARAQDSPTTNFMVNFNKDMAICAFDLSVDSVASVLDASRPGEAGTRWMNIWSPYCQRPLLEHLAQRFDFSPRLLALMCSNPHESRYFEPSSVDLESSWRPFWHRHAQPDDGAIEKGQSAHEMSDKASISSASSAMHGNLYQIIDNIWHYCSVDFARNYICLGYNSLYSTKASGDESEDSPLPQCTRVWTWLLLCKDNTVISITEDPFPHMRGKPLTDPQRRILSETRQNITNVFRSLSLANAGPLTTTNPLKLLPIRRGLDVSPDGIASHTSDAPSSLFYYLFENWHNSYTLVTRRESRFGVELAALRAEMFTRPRLRHIDRLDRVGKDLNVLRRHFDAHKRIIERVIEPRGPLAARGALGALQTVHVVNELSSHHHNNQRHRPGVDDDDDDDDVRSAVVVTTRERDGGVGGGNSQAVVLTAATKARFQRLRDLIDVYALSEVEQYIKEKDALVSMNFNLIAIKQSGDVERLTRITLLLTKITILVTPVSLMTAYFSVPLENVSFTVPVYWISFAIVLFLSWLTLIILGVFNGNVDSFEAVKGIWIGLRRTFKYVIGH